MTLPASRFRLAETGALLADPARAGILLALIDGSARPAGELATVAGVAAATASVHLRKLCDGGLLIAIAQGRHRYYRIADENAAHLIETIALASAAPTPSALPRGRVDADLRCARTCYRHLAGWLGVGVFEALREHAAIALTRDAVCLNASGVDWLRGHGLFADAGDPTRLGGRTCVDWSERRFHLSGALGTALTRQFFEAGWLRRCRDTRALRVSPRGRAGFRALGVDWDELHIEDRPKTLKNPG